jgi:alkyl sulfatase BDS1-like metallo-beta-lactamase superfamily hydrolase
MTFKRIFVPLAALAALGLLTAAGLYWKIKPDERSVHQTHTVSVPADLEKHCKEAVGPPRVEEVADGVFVALGYDLANTILVRTAEGNVVIDVGMSPERAEPVRKALLEKSPGPVTAVVYTHSHIDHVGGASVWIEEDTEVWASANFRDHFMKQYARFRPIETRRAARQFGSHVGEDDLPCSALGRRIDIAAAARTGARMPTKTFSGQTDFEIGGVRFELIEAHGETHDQLFVWLPDKEVLMPGDNYYRAFPNLYTIRGTSPRPVDAWIRSLDQMRRKNAAFLVPSHTVPIAGKDEIRRALTRYRDGIQWVRDRVVEGANRGDTIEELVATIGLPKDLADDPALAPLYGQIDWSVRAIYGNHLGWFDGRPEALYPLAEKDKARKTITSMGGEDQVWRAVQSALSDDPKWALHLLSLLAQQETTSTAPGSRWASTKSKALRAVASKVGNTNGRAYLLESALELDEGPQTTPKAVTSEKLLDEVPIGLFFEVMSTRLIPERSADVHETVAFHFTDIDERFVVTVRRGVAEVVHGEPLPETPLPVARVSTTTATWKGLAVGKTKPASVIADGSLSIDGDALAFATFTRRFRQGF